MEEWYKINYNSNALGKTIMFFFLNYQLSKNFPDQHHFKRENRRHVRRDGILEGKFLLMIDDTEGQILMFILRVEFIFPFDGGP